MRAWKPAGFGGVGSMTCGPAWSVGVIVCVGGVLAGGQEASRMGSKVLSDSRGPGDFKKNSRDPGYSVFFFLELVCHVI